MRIVELDDANERTWLVCLKDWADEPQGLSHRAEWHRRLKNRGLRVELAVMDDGVVGGMIQYLPIEYSMATGQGLYFIQCTWVHGYSEGPGNLQRRGMGKALLASAEKHAKELGAKGIAAWGNTFPGWMPVAWLLGKGYVEADRNGPRVLVWKSFASDAVPPRWRTRREVPAHMPGEVTVTVFFSPWCMDACDFYEAVLATVAEMAGKVRLKLIDTSRPETLDEWGISNAVFVNDREITGGIEELRKVIAEELLQS